MKIKILVLLFLVSSLSFGQDNDKISTLDFVQILNDNKEEIVFYYQNNWKILREMAIDKAYIDSFQLLETSFTEEAPFHFILITTYLNKAQYDLREERFTELIKEKGDLKLLNDKKPKEFRKILFNKENVKHL